MMIRVRLLAFCEAGTVREVNVPTEEMAGDAAAQLERVFYWGQNDFQPLPLCSVSVGDVAELGDRFYVCRPLGWAEISEAELTAYENLPRRDRQFSSLADPNLERQP